MEDPNDIKVIDETGFEKIIGRNGLRRIDWLQLGLDKSRSVCKVHSSKGDIGSGFLVEGGYLFTNNHVIGSPSVAQFSQIEMGYDDPNKKSVFYDLDHTEFLTSDSNYLDYTKVKVKDNPDAPLSQWGHLTLKGVAPEKDAALIIVQHPRGRRKELAFSDGYTSILDHKLHYRVTTEPGSSGSPVFDINWEVIAIHHAGGHLPVSLDGKSGEVNEGILFKYILDDLVDKQNKTQVRKKVLQ